MGRSGHELPLHFDPSDVIRGYLNYIEICGISDSSARDFIDSLAWVLTHTGVSSGHVGIYRVYSVLPVIFFSLSHFHLLVLLFKPGL